MADYDPEPGESRPSAWLNRHPVLALVLGALLVGLGILFGVLRALNH